MMNKLTIGPEQCAMSKDKVCGENDVDQISQELGRLHQQLKMLNEREQTYTGPPPEMNTQATLQLSR